VLRFFFPESQQFIQAKQNAKQNTPRQVSGKGFWKETWDMLRNEWRMFIYCVVLMTWFNFYRYEGTQILIF
jgi:hypothetical protein